ncbi:hypothetical protein JTE90_028519 [Oedothorax gibbosus]|uniref:Uncharacterized protein n=1 Tax=Oedothorax gibbosus TaxID=931172 RepID=A0AAV6VTR7_9ARAC|nr:hypothetical protein JTE90_028519 [Oedothorax gibbosus]
MQRWIFIVFFGVAAGIATVHANENCDSVHIMKCISAKNQAASEGKLFFPDTREKLMEYCKHLMDGLNCARRMIDECIGEEERHLYYNLTHDMVSMNEALCSEGSTFSTRFLKHVDCYKSLSDRFRICSNQYIGNIVVVQQLSQEEQMKMTCCTVHEYDRCMRNAVDGRCEPDAQKLVQETVVTALKQSFGYCQQLPSVPTSNCQRTFSESKGFATGTLDGNGENNSQTRNLPFALLLLVLLFMLLT